MRYFVMPLDLLWDKNVTIFNRRHLKENTVQKFSLHTLLAAAGLAVALSAHAQAPAGAPPGSTVECKDGTFAAPATKKGACSNHKGVKTWFGPAAAAAAPAPAPAPAAKSAPAPAPAAPAPAPKAQKTAPAPAVATAAGGGAGKVWVNLDTKVYHCQGDRWYGKTKKGEYMSEAQALAQGAHAAHAKACGG